jgi:RimJ/RimL family protein N-acetyltransferase
VNGINDMRRIGNLETERLTVRPFVMADFEPYRRITLLCFGDEGASQDPSINDGPPTIETSRRMHEWRVLNEEMLARLYQAPYGDRAIVLRDTGVLIGSVGLVPYMDTFNIVPGLRFIHGDDGSKPRATAEVGMFWAIDPAYHGQGYATEAARAMIDYLFAGVHLQRVIATAAFDNLASQAVMRKLGMRLERNETGRPPWLQVVGVLDNPA